MASTKDYLDNSWQNVQPWMARMAPPSLGMGAGGPNPGIGGSANPYGETPAQKAAAYNAMIASGMTDAQIRQKINSELGEQSDADWGYLQGLASTTQGAPTTPTTTTGALTQVSAGTGGGDPFVQQDWSTFKPWERAPTASQGNVISQPNPYGETPAQKAAAYNAMIASGMTDAQIRQKINSELGEQSDADWMYLRGLAAAGNRPQTGTGAGSGGGGDQFFPTPVLNSLYANQQQRMLTSAPQFNFQSGVRTPSPPPKQPREQGGWGSSPGARAPWDQGGKAPAYESGGFGSGGPAPWDVGMVGGNMRETNPWTGSNNGKAPAYESEGLGSGGPAPWDVGMVGGNMPTGMSSAQQALYAKLSTLQGQGNPQEVQDYVKGLNDVQAYATLGTHLARPGDAGDSNWLTELNRMGNNDPTAYANMLKDSIATRFPTAVGTGQLGMGAGGPAPFDPAQAQPGALTQAIAG